MTAVHMFRHLAIAYASIHNLHAQSILRPIVTKQEKSGIFRRLEILERRCELAVIQGDHSAKAHLEKIRALKNLAVASH